MPRPIHVLTLAGLSLVLAGNPVQICSQAHGLGQSAPNWAMLQMDKELAMQTVVVRDPEVLANRSESVAAAEVAALNLPRADHSEVLAMSGALHEELRDWSTKSLCIVGNGPLSEDDHKEISKCPVDHLVRFNSMVNLPENEEVGHLYANACSRGWWGVTSLQCNRMRNATEVVLFGEGAKAQASLETFAERYGVKFILGIDDGEHLTIDGKNFDTHNVNGGFSIGFKGIAYARWRYPSATLEVYGFNWNAPKKNYGHPFKVEKEAVANMKNLRIHPTPLSEHWHGGRACGTSTEQVEALLQKEGGSTNVTEAWSLWAGETLDDF